jgi:hypothetical protein
VRIAQGPHIKDRVNIRLIHPYHEASHWRLQCPWGSECNKPISPESIPAWRTYHAESDR